MRSVPSKLGRAARLTFGALACAAAFFAAGCHSNNQTSGYGVAWVTLTDSPGDFTTYTVTVDSITLTRNDGAVVGAIATPEVVDFTKLDNVSELWGTATIATGTYTSASIVLDYTSAVVAVLGADGLPHIATVVDSTGAALTTVTVNVNFDPANLPNIVPTYATTAAIRLALDFNLSASTQSINLGTTPATVTVKPYWTAAIAPPDNKMVRVRGPLINSSVDLATYTVYVRPFFDEVDNLGSLSLFADANTIYSVNGVASAGAAGISQLSQSSTGTTVTASYTTYEPTPTPAATAAIFHVKYMIGGSTLEDIYTQGMEGDVIARTGNTLTLRGSTTQFNDGTSTYNAADTVVLVGPGTTVTADGTVATGLNYNSVAVGQHIIARGVQTSTCPSTTATPCTIDATGSSATNTGSVRLIQTAVWGPLVSAATGNIVLDLSTINNWPVGDFNFAGNGAAPPTAAAFSINSGALAIPDTTVGDPLWITGLVAPFGSAPPDFNATAVNSELSVQTVGTSASAPTPLSCGQATQVCTPASMRVYWTGGTTAPFSSLTAAGATVDLSNAKLLLAVIRIGPESIDMKSLAASPQIIPTVPLPFTSETAPGGPGPVLVPPVVLPEYSYGDPLTTAPGGISQFSVFGTFVTGLTKALPTTAALQLEARGTYNRATNTFTAISVNVVL